MLLSFILDIRVKTVSSHKTRIPEIVKIVYFKNDRNYQKYL